MAPHHSGNAYHTGLTSTTQRHPYIISVHDRAPLAAVVNSDARFYSGLTNTPRGGQTAACCSPLHTGAPGSCRTRRAQLTGEKSGSNSIRTALTALLSSRMIGVTKNNKNAPLTKHDQTERALSAAPLLLACSLPFFSAGVGA